MPFLRFLFLWLLTALLAFSSLADARDDRARRDDSPAISVTALPPEARDTLRLIERGGPFPYRRDGIEFQNREHRLPAQPRGYYREYTVPTPGARDRGARRIIAGEHRDYYYTADHYRSFQRIQP
ncbi:MAG: guanyl-specific ribonuclease Sa [Proteobacteria bacterium]|nr:guanyl-specific ribonuclease Sa [Pseudomonadota bacterium]